MIQLHFIVTEVLFKMTLFLFRLGVYCKKRIMKKVTAAIPPNWIHRTPYTTLFFLSERHVH